MIAEIVHTNGATRLKARLVSPGFEKDMSEERRDSPTCARDSLTVIFAVISRSGWCCNSMDVKTAFLLGEDREREVYVCLSPEFNNSYLWRLNKTVHGLCDAAWCVYGNSDCGLFF